MVIDFSLDKLILLKLSISKFALDLDPEWSLLIKIEK